MDWIDRIEGLSPLPQDLRAALLEGAKVIRAPLGEVVFSPEDPADHLFFLLTGTVRVFRRSESGREVDLYRVHAGESCVLTTASMMAHEENAAEGRAETEIEAVIVPRAVFDDLAGRSADFRQFLFRAYSRRMADLFGLIDDIVFRRLDARLAEALIARAKAATDPGLIAVTHQMLATELGSAREVISRLLADFQRHGWIAQARGEIRLSDPEALARLARRDSGN